MGSEFLKRSCYDRILRNFSKLSTRHIFENLFPLDWCNPLTENMMILRGTQPFKNVLEEIILEVFNSGCELTYGQIGRVVMIMFGSGKLSTAIYEMVAERFDINPSWKAFIRNFKGLMGSKISDVYPTEGILVLKLHDALSDALKIDWRHEVDFMSPNCFLYLVDRFLFLVSYNQECLFTTKSSFIEWLICQELETSPSARSVAEMRSSVTGAYDFLACIVNQLLVNKFNTMEWIKRSNLSLKYYTHLVLRLVVVICLLCLNSGKYFDVLQNLIGRTDISSQLPLDFFDFLQGREKLEFDFVVNVFGKALAKIGNPLVTVSLENEQKFSCPEAISVSRNDIQSQESLLKKLFREEVSDIQLDHGSAPEVDLEKSFHSLTIASCQSSSTVDDGNSSENVNFVDDESKTSIASAISDYELENIITSIKSLHLGSPKPEDPLLNDLIAQNDIIDSASKASKTSIASGSPKKMEEPNSKAKQKKSNSEKGKEKVCAQKPVLVWKRKHK
ncbi:hypothetical protein LguiA_031453 [Lonicera macranthoides]